MAEKQNDLTRTILGALFIVALLGMSLWILRPFLAALIWAVTIVVATWPLLKLIQTWLGGRRWAAVTVMTLILLCVLVVPLTAAIGVIVANTETILAWVKSLTHYEITVAPEWVTRLPFIGGPAAEAWNKLAASGIQGIVSQAWPYTGGVIKWFVSHIGSLGALFVEFLMTVLLSALLYAHGERAADQAMRFGHRLAGRRGGESVLLAGQAIRGIALGVVVTAMAQSVLGGLALLATGVPWAPVLTAVMFMLAVAQIGAVPVLGAAVAWLYWSGSTAAGTVLLVLTVVVGTMDNFLRPYLIKRGADLPLLLIFVGVIGGLMAFGIIGIFIGPVVLAVAYTLAGAWVEGETAVESNGAGDPSGEAPLEGGGQ